MQRDGLMARIAELWATTYANMAGTLVIVAFVCAGEISLSLYSLPPFLQSWLWKRGLCWHVSFVGKYTSI